MSLKILLMAIITAVFRYEQYHATILQYLPYIPFYSVLTESISEHV